jgi:hypothetical protein
MPLLLDRERDFTQRRQMNSKDKQQMLREAADLESRFG